MTTEGTWIGYSGTARIGLARVLLALALAGALAYAGTRWPGPFRARRPRPAVAHVMLAIWILAITAFLVCASVYVHQARRDFPGRTAPTDPITPVTVIGVGLVFIVILSYSRLGTVAKLASAVIGALAAPMIFELPFDLIVMTRTYPIPPDPALYRVLFFLPLFAIELLMLALLTLSPMVRLSRATFLSFAAMLAVFAVWALSGFGYPLCSPPHHAECRVEDPGLRNAAHPVPARAGRRQRAWSRRPGTFGPARLRNPGLDSRTVMSASAQPRRCSPATLRRGGVPRVILFGLATRRRAASACPGRGSPRSGVAITVAGPVLSRRWSRCRAAPR